MSKQFSLPRPVAAVALAGLFFGMMIGARTASAGPTNPCGSAGGDVCSYISNGCEEGQACSQVVCYTLFCLSGQAGPGSVCWRCSAP
jgi:hypothetical protein